ncbi:MAG: DUF1295 domain-containing protein, partial [Chitinophagales bacterium]|nr:DUF1295 domain-containing protein [Chitinophagales bacterium]
MMKIDKKKSLAVVSITYLLALGVAAITVFILGESYSPLLKGAVADIVATVFVYFSSLIFRNSSMYDPYWSVAPPVLAIYWINAYDKWNVPQILMLATITFWAVRLTLNWIKGWQGMSHEDWRYVMLKKKTQKFYQIVNFTGIHLFPTVMVFLGMLPVYYFIKEAVDVNLVTIAGMIISLTGTAFEYFADEQLRQFKKQSTDNSAITHGLWKYSRHPNYFGEILFWLGLWIMAMSANQNLWPLAVGCIAMYLMF